jgi:DNA polymerase III delta prime subunit
MDLSESLGTLSHHAYTIVGGANVRLALVSFLEREHDIRTRGNPDFFMQKYEVLTIGDARALKLAHATRPFSVKSGKDGEEGKKFFIIELDSITEEAQNALLKVFEEPNEYAHFFLIIPSAELLLPTLRSRLYMVRAPIEKDGEEEGGKGRDVKVDKNLADFLLGSKAERIAFVDRLATDISDGKKPKTAALDLCASLSRHLRNDGIKKNAQALAILAETESYLRDRAPSVKQLLEYVSLSV